MVTRWSSTGWVPAVSIVSVLQIRICVHLSVNGCERTQFHVQVVFSGVWPSFFVTIIFALPSSRYLFSSFQRCLLLLASHCFMSTKFFLLYPALNDWPFMKYASNYFLRAPSPCLLVLYYPPPLAELVFAHARSSSSFFSRLV